MLHQRIETIVASLRRGLQEKEELVRLALLATLAGEHLFLYGPPGTAKSLIARRLTGVFRDGKRFEQLLGRFTTPEELFGPISITRMKDHDRYERITEGYLPEADIVFLDEIWNASSPILNTLLTAINERRFRNGQEELILPLKSVISASASLPPDDPALCNLWDRFLLRLPVRYVEQRESFLALLNHSDSTVDAPIPRDEQISIDELDEWQDRIEAVEIPGDVLELIHDVRERILRHNAMQEKQGTPPVAVSDRRWSRLARLLRTSAFFNDRTAVNVLDCILMRHCLWSRDEEIEVVDTIVRQAVHRYATSGRFDPSLYREQFEEVTARIREAGVEVMRESVVEPVEYRGEYYRVMDFVEDHQTLIWIGDYQQLGESRATETDLFFYGPDEDYAYSERFSMRRDGDLAVIIGDERYYIEVHETEEDREQAVEIAPEVQAELVARLTAILSETTTVASEIERYRDANSGAAEQHLFVHRSFAGIVTTGMNQASRDLQELRSEIGLIMETLTAEHRGEAD